MSTDDREALCELMHDAYEKAAAGAGWETQTASRAPWAEVPEPNKIAMRAAVDALLSVRLAGAERQIAAIRADTLREAADAQYVGSITVRAFQAWLRRRAAAVLSDDGSPEMTKAPRPADAERG